MSPVRILIADDHEVVRQGVRAVLGREPGWVVCGEAGTGREAVTKAVALRPDVVVLDVAMPDLNGLEATRQIRRACPAARIVVLTVHDADQVVAEVLGAGAHGYVLKTDAGRKLVDVIRALRQRRTFFEGAHVAAARRAGPAPGVSSGRQLRRLSPREREVVQLLAEGRSNKEIGSSLGITVKTAETHRAHIMAKLDLHSMSALTRYAIRNRIIEP